MLDFATARDNMVEGQLRTRDVTDLRILAAMGELPRERFVPADRRAFAYMDEDLLLKPGSGGMPPRYLMEPTAFARLVQLAEIGPQDHVLDIGSGTGYGAAVLSRLAGSVVALEGDPDLLRMAETALAELGVGNVTLVSGPLEAGYPAVAPYDVILLEGAVEVLPEALLQQLKDGGRLVAVEGQGRSATAMRHVRVGDEFSGVGAFDCAVPLLPGFAKAPSFTF
ncbi:MAG: protein-L-isoaspartate O-methyltransferase [Pseudomonadota bacterium]|nr:protein-L-isoaspartate O-methyltransferase [Pseudomonadota bacterium]